MAEMTDLFPGKPRRVLIVSSHPLFGKGLRNLLQDRKEADVVVVGIVSSVEEAVNALNNVTPDLVIVDYDDDKVNRDEFLAHFVEGAQRLRVVLLSLKEGGSQAIVYDRRSLAASEIDDWLKEWNDTGKSPVPAAQGAGKSVFTKTGPAFFRSRFRQGIRNDQGSEFEQRRTSMKHFLFAIGLVIALTALTVFGLRALPLLPTAASLQAQPIDELFSYHFFLIAFLFSLIVGFMLYSIIVFRRKPGDESDGDHIEGNTRLEILWTLAPLAAVVFFSYLGAVILGEIERPDPRPMEVNIVASQWSWRFEYPDNEVISNELVLPINQQVLFRMVSTDVIHSFWVPEFRVKQDILPGGENMIRELRVTPNLVGDFTLRCAEMCGEQHSIMEAPVKVVSQNDFVAWLDEQAALVPEDPIDRGQLWARQNGCLACHTTDGTPGIGPTWKDVYGHEVLLDDGSTVFADEEYLYESITQPGEKIVAGFSNIMPNLSEQLTEEQIQEIIEFIKSLSEQ
jgi:cytochrome c oxidase subunit II